MQLPSHPAAIDGEHRAGDVVAGGATEIEGGTGDVLRLAPAGGGDALEDLAVAGLVGLQGFGVGGGEVAGGDGVDPDVLWRPLVGEGFCELRDAAFAGRVGGDADASLKAEQAGDVHDLAAGVACDDIAGEELAELEDAGEVDLQDLLPTGEGGVDGGVAVDGAGVVDEDVDVAEAVVSGGEEGLRAGCGPEIGLEGGGFGADGGGGLGCGAAIAVDGDESPGLRECDGDGRAQAAGGSGDEGDFAVEAEGIEDVGGRHTRSVAADPTHAPKCGA